MNNKAILLIVDEARALADAGIDYSVRYGAVCPVCGKVQLPTVTTRPWKENTRTRFHKCNNQDCILCRMGISIKSLQIVNE